jgi:hypothetical protein
VFYFDCCPERASDRAEWELHRRGRAGRKGTVVRTVTPLIPFPRLELTVKLENLV